MSLILEDAPVSVADGSDTDLRHVVCCDDDVALCGKNVTGHPWYPDDEETTCPLCAYAEEEDLACPVPGCPGVPVLA